MLDSVLTEALPHSAELTVGLRLADEPNSRSLYDTDGGASLFAGAAEACSVVGTNGGSLEVSKKSERRPSVLTSCSEGVACFSVSSLGLVTQLLLGSRSSHLSDLE